jgi:hypothetical protein
MRMIALWPPVAVAQAAMVRPLITARCRSRRCRRRAPLRSQRAQETPSLRLTILISMVVRMALMVK